MVRERQTATFPIIAGAGRRRHGKKRMMRLSSQKSSPLLLQLLLLLQRPRYGFSFKPMSDDSNKRLKMSTPENPRIIALFDVDGTLTIPRGEITSDMLAFMKDLSKKITVGIVGGSDLPKQEEQLGEGIVNLFPYNFSQNGLVAYKNGELLESQTIAKFLGEDNIKRVINWTLKYFSELDLPVKVGLCLTFACFVCVRCIPSHSSLTPAFSRLLLLARHVYWIPIGHAQYLSYRSKLFQGRT